MNTWTSQSNPGKQTLWALVCAVLGGLLLVAAGSSGGASGNAKAGLALGVLLLVIGIWGWLASGPQTVVIDPKTRCITVTDVNRLGSKRRVIRFDDITSVGIGYLGKRSNFVQMHYLNLHLTSGQTYALFAPGRFYEGASSRTTVEGWQYRLEQYLQQGSR